GGVEGFGRGGGGGVLLDPHCRTCRRHVRHRLRHRDRLLGRRGERGPTGGLAGSLVAPPRYRANGAAGLASGAPPVGKGDPWHAYRSPSTGSRARLRSNRARSSCTSSGRASGSPGPTSVATPRRAARARSCSTTSRGGGG